VLPKCLERISIQRFIDFEVLVIDYKSDDGTEAIAKAYAFVRWLSLDQPGIYEAMNKGLTEARGKYLWFLGADDLLYEEWTLSKVAHAVKGYDLLIADIENFPSGSVTRYQEFEPQSLKDRPICHQALVCHKSVFDKVGHFDTRYKLAADYAFQIKAFGQYELSYHYLPEKVVRYDQRGASAVPLDLPFLRDKHRLVSKYLKTIDNGKAGDYRQIGHLGLQMLRLRKYRKAFAALWLASLFGGNSIYYIREVLAHFKNR
jgi:glycosyltransferase involved in cell wall biosynthesis